MKKAVSTILSLAMAASLATSALAEKPDSSTFSGSTYTFTAGDSSFTVDHVVSVEQVTLPMMVYGKDAEGLETMTPGKIDTELVRLSSSEAAKGIAALSEEDFSSLVTTYLQFSDGTYNIVGGDMLLTESGEVTFSSSEWGSTPLFSVCIDSAEVYFTFEGTEITMEKKPTETVTPGAPLTAFTDVKAGAYYEAPIAWAVEKGVTQGTTKSTFSPDATCTIPQILTFLWRAEGSPEPKGQVTDTAYYAKALVWAYENGIYRKELTDPSTPCTRGLTVDFLWRLAHTPTVEISQLFEDVPIENPACVPVAWAVQNGITKGATEKTFAPDATCTRGQIATFLYRALAD